MSDDIKVGDVCVIVAPASEHLRNLECTVVDEEKLREVRVHHSEHMEVWATCHGFTVVLAGSGRRYCIARICLRKMRPPAGPIEVVRQETVPRADFDLWLERVRQQQREEEPA